MKILYIYEQIDTTVVVNMTYLKSLLDEKTESREKLSRNVCQVDIDWCQICIAIRPSTVYSLSVASSIKGNGRTFVAFYDDDLLNLPANNSAKWRKPFIKRILGAAGALMSPSSVIVSEYKHIAPSLPGIIFKIYVPDEEILPVIPCGEKIRIVYAAGNDHKVMFEKYIKPSIDRILEQYPNVELHFIGVSPDMSDVHNKDRIVRHVGMPYQEYKEFMKTNRFDIGLSPLSDTPFCNRKYFNKYLEYTKDGMVGLYSNCLPYTLVVKDGINGFLVNNDVNSWFDAIKHAIENIIDMKSIAEFSQDHLKSDFSFANAQKEILDNLSSIVGNDFAHVRYKKQWIKGFLFDIVDNGMNLYCHLKYEGFREVLKKISEKRIGK